MTTSTKRLTKGFTLIELLTVIAIIGILAAIIIPTVGKVRETAQRSVASSNLRQVGQASLIYASDNKDKLPGGGALGNTNAQTTSGGSLYGVAFQLAYQGGLNDATIWYASPDLPSTPAQSTIKNQAGTGLLTSFTDPAYLSYSYVGGLNAGSSSTIPVAFTKGLQTTGKWVTGTTTNTGSPWNGDGGHIVFVGGNVAWYRDLTGSNALVSSNGATTSNLVETLPAAVSASTYGIFKASTPSAAMGGL